MRLLGFNQYGIWPEDDWKTNLIWEAIRLSFISLAVSPVDLCGSFCHLFLLNTHHSKCQLLVYTTPNKASKIDVNLLISFSIEESASTKSQKGVCDSFLRSKITHSAQT